MIAKLSLSEESRVIEIAANDGYLLQYFKEYNIECLGIEPTKSKLMKQEKNIKV